MRISRELKPENLFTVAGSGSGMRWLRIGGMDAELTVTEADAADLSEFFATLAAEMGQEVAS
ncbi:hypothetical protein AB0O80_10400 [Rothia kristinae]|uniref:hypothetical protein n=1 Tax=Actinomycetes TaxID=1760 RepID=UPI00343B5A92